MSEELEEMIEFQWMSLTLVDYRKDIQLQNLCTSYLSWNVLSLPSLPSLLLLASVLRNISSFYFLHIEFLCVNVVNLRIVCAVYIGARSATRPSLCLVQVRSWRLIC